MPQEVLPQKFQSVQDYLLALGFTIVEGKFVRGQRQIDPEELSLHTPLSFSEKAKKHGWLEEDSSDSSFEMYQWGNQFILFGDD